jgi:endonuclease/exonuclease/phosphatase family metal-dependent hydrolase
MTGNVKVFAMTFNINSAKPTSQTFSFIPPGFDLYVFGFQEVGPFVPIACVKFQQGLTEALIGHFGSTWHVVCDQTLLALKLFVIAPPDFGRQITVSFVRSIATGVDGTYGNKGACVCSLKVNGTTSFLLITAHFEAHDRNVELRNENYASILKSLQTLLKCNPLSSHHYCFFLGDLNYRIELAYQEVKRLAQSGRYAELIASDQLSKEKRAMHVFSGFFEEEIHFPPTYRFDKNSMSYDTSEKMRVPSFTDRILVYARNRRNVQLVSYSANMDMLISDHRPVLLHATARLVEADEDSEVPQRTPRSAVCAVA